MRALTSKMMPVVLLGLSMACSKPSGPPAPAVAPAEPAAAPAEPASPPDAIEAAVDPATASVVANLAGSATGTGEDSLKAALLGLGKKNDAAEVQDDPPPKRRRSVRRAAVRSPAEDLAEEIPVPRDLSDYQFQEAVNSWRGMRTCLARSTARGGERSGAMKVAFKIRNDGSVSNCEVVETSNTLAAKLAPCVERSARRIRFPSFDGKEVEKQAKFVF